MHGPDTLLRSSIRHNLLFPVARLTTAEVTITKLKMPFLSRLEQRCLKILIKSRFTGIHLADTALPCSNRDQ